MATKQQRLSCPTTDKQAKKRPGEGSEKANYELIAFA